MPAGSGSVGRPPALPTRSTMHLLNIVVEIEVSVVPAHILEEAHRLLPVCNSNSNSVNIVTVAATV